MSDAFTRVGYGPVKRNRELTFGEAALLQQWNNASIVERKKIDAWLKAASANRGR